MLDYYAQPLAALDSSCIADMRAPPFEVATGNN
jgi:hypothetical protein